MLFICHQMAMKQEAEEKKRLDGEQRKRQGINVPVIWVLGGPGCGKGTQCEKIVEKYKFQHFSTGDLLRAEVASGSDKGKELAAIMQSGKLVSNDDVLQVLQSAMHKVENPTGFLIDGYPREKDQGTAFEKQVAPVDLVLYFDCSDDTMCKRILHRAAQSVEKRADDNEETIKTRLCTFRTNTNAILSQYQDKTMIINVERPVDEIFVDVQNAIEAIIVKKKAAATA